MPESTSKVSLVRCPKCGRLLPQLPSYSIYSCVGCGCFFRAQTKLSRSDDISENSRREVNHGGVIGVDHESNGTPIRVSKSPLRIRFGDPIRTPPVGEMISDGLSGSDVQSKSFGRSSKGDAKKSPLKEGVEKAPMVGIEGRRSAMRDDFDLGATAEQVYRRANQSDAYGNSYDTRRLKVQYDGCLDEGDHGVARRKPREIMERWRDDRIWFDEARRVPVNHYNRSSNYRAGLLRKYNELHEKLIRIGDLISYSQDGQRDQGISPSEFAYEEFSQVRNETVRKSCDHKQSMDSTYNARKENLHHQACSCSDCYTDNLQADVYRKCTLDPTVPYSTHNMSSRQKGSDGRSSASAHDQKKRVLVPNQNGRICHPIARGAPFVICYNCFQLLRVPGKLNQFKLHCGSCRTILSIDFNTKSSKSNSADVCDEPCGVVAESHHSVRKSKSCEFTANGFKFQYADSEPSSSIEATEKSVFSASSSQACKGDHFSESDVCSEAEKPSVRDSIILANRFDDKESDTSHQYQGTAQRGEISNTDTSNGTDSADTSDRKHQGTSPDSPRSLNTKLAKADVLVNGKPLTPYAVRRAEKMAGPILPGDYWYDPRAGFWGVMGGLCLGIIPPCIEEFSSQMPENCCGGDTCVYVNGRELHENDLNLLSSRGLPRTRYKYYVLDICGIVEDEETGGFVVDLGKLAPTVEVTGCGFGMETPETYND